MKRDENFNHMTLDIHGNTAPVRWTGSRWKHSGNGKTYVVIGVTWLGATDEWAVMMHEFGYINSVLVTRPEHHLTGLRDNGERRYEQVL